MEQIMNTDMKGGLDGVALSEAAAAAVALLAGLPEAERQAAVRASGFGPTRRSWTPRDIGALPVLTEMVRDRDRDSIFSSPLWTARYRRGLCLVVYLLQASGLAALSAALGGTSLVKVGTADTARITPRIAALGREGYGAWVRTPEGYRPEAGFKNFEPARRLQLARQHPASPVALCRYGLEVTLPESMTHSRFEAALNWRLDALRLQSLADTVAGRALCDRTGVDPARLRRFYKCGTTFKAATEITLLRPQADVGALARLCADIVVDEVLGLADRRPVR